MNKNIFNPICIAVIALASVLAAPAANAQTDTQKAFATIKSLPGMWEGKSSEGGAVKVDFKVTSGGSAVTSEIIGKEDMISVFNMDGPNRLILTHYCVAGNQPRMQASVSGDGKTITFTFVDATGLSTPEAGHMQKMTLNLIDDNHHTEDWIFVDHGKEISRVFDLHRML
jgi:hypothetical protein